MMLKTKLVLVLGLCGSLATSCGGGSSKGGKPKLPELKSVVSYGTLIGRYALTAQDKYPKRLDTLRMEHKGTNGEISYSFIEPSGAVRANPARGTMLPGEKATITIEADGLSFTKTELKVTFIYIEHGSTDQLDVQFPIVTNDGNFPDGKLKDVLMLTAPDGRYLLTPNLTYPQTLGSGSIKYTAPTGLSVTFEVLDQLGHVAATPSKGLLEAVKGMPNDPKREAKIDIQAIRSQFGIARLTLRAKYDVLAHPDQLVADWSIRNVAPPHLAAFVAVKVLSDNDPRIPTRFWPPLVLAPYGVVVKHPVDPKFDKVPSLKFTEIEVVGAMRLGLSLSQLSKAFWADKSTRGGSGEALFPPGQGRNGYTIHPRKELAQKVDDYFMVHVTMEHSVPIKDVEPKNIHVYTFAFDSDLSNGNNYAPPPAVPNDFHKSTDRWYDVMYDASNGWVVAVQQVDTSNKVTEVSSAARVIITDNSILLVVPKSEFPAAKPLWRSASFVYQPGPPSLATWSGDVMPALGNPLLVVN